MIYSFDLVDRESHTIKLRSEAGQRIGSSLTLRDLFSFDVLEGGGGRYNFEALFGRYEAEVKQNTESLLAKIARDDCNLVKEVVDVCAAKMLNFVRNPYSIPKMLNTFGTLTRLQPTNPQQLEDFSRVIKGRKPHQKYLCEQLGITESDYSDWLSIIFLLLTPPKDTELNFLEEVVRSLFTDPNLYVSVYVHTFSEERCLLSDRGFSIALPEEDGLAFDFNLCSNAFIRYVFVRLDRWLPPDMPERYVTALKSVPRAVHLIHDVDNLALLHQYNGHVIYQCFDTVFSSAKQWY